MKFQFKSGHLVYPAESLEAKIERTEIHALLGEFALSPELTEKERQLLYLTAKQVRTRGPLVPRSHIAICAGAEAWALDEVNIKAIHILWEGRALCGQEGLPGEWPPGHRWVARKGLEQATCPGCLTNFELQLKALADEPKGPPP